MEIIAVVGEILVVVEEEQVMEEEEEEDVVEMAVEVEETGAEEVGKHKEPDGRELYMKHFSD